MRRAFLAAALALSLAGPARAETPLTYGYVPTDGNLAEFVAKEKGLYARRGLAVTLLPIPNGGTIPAAALSGSIQIGTYTSSGLLQAVEGGVDLVGTMAETRATKQVPGAYLIRRADLAIASPADLKGRNAGVSAYNNVLDLLLRKWLVLQGVAPAQVHILETPFISMHDLMRAGRIDFATAVDPFGARIIEDGTGVAFADFLNEIHPDMVLPVIFTTRAWFAANTPTMAAFRDATAEAVTAIAADPDEARRIERIYLKIETRNLPKYDVTLRPEDLEIFNRIGKELGAFAGTADPAKVVPTY